MLASQQEVPCVLYRSRKDHFDAATFPLECQDGSRAFFSPSSHSVCRSTFPLANGRLHVHGHLVFSPRKRVSHKSCKPLHQIPLGLLISFTVITLILYFDGDGGEKCLNIAVVYLSASCNQIHAFVCCLPPSLWSMYPDQLLLNHWTSCPCWEGYWLIAISARVASFLICIRGSSA